jgi:hypothetical protein
MAMMASGIDCGEVMKLAMEIAGCFCGFEEGWLQFHGGWDSVMAERNGGV